MGCGLSKKESIKAYKGIQNKVLEMNSSHDMAIHKKLVQLMDLSSNLNINSKYEFFLHILKDEFVGEGIFRTN